ncbi:MAG: alkaline phosphatase, partial [Saprospiraceae bacterium]|nr:alkaline phosphatase [Saprospiraceae bacterium]
MTLRLPLLFALFISVLASPLAAQTLVHYWNFNNSASEAEQLSTSFSLVNGSTIQHEQGGISLIQITSNTAQGFEVLNANARFGDPSGTHLRFNDPIGGALRFNLPTTGYQQVIVKYATRRSGSGAGLQIIEYSTDGVTFDSLTSIEPANGDPTLQTIDFSGVPGVSDNADFAVRIRFAQGLGGLVGNNRFDNFTLEGIGAGADVVPPTVVLQPIDGAVDQPVNLQPTLTFNEDVRLVSNAAITPADILNIIEWRLDSANGASIAF